MAKLPVSVCLISGAEASRISRALESVAAWAGEVIVVVNEDVGDGTEQIATRYGAKVFREPWKGFIAQKNSAADKSAQPWLLNLDADEVVSPALAAEIAAALTAPATPYAAFEFPRRTFYCERWIRHGDWYPDRIIRLWKRGVARWTGEDPHARLEVSGAVGRLHSDVLHYSNESINRQLDKIGPYADAFVRHCLETGRKAGWLDLTVRPVWKFFRAYFFRLGFLDGWPGYYIAWLGAFSTVTRYAKVREARLKSEC